MAHYTLLDQYSLETILDNYPLGSPQDVSPLDGGQANSSTIFSTDDGKYVISVCDEKSFAELDLLTLSLEHLEKHNIATTRLIRTKDDRRFIEYDSKPVYIKEFIEGTVPGSLTSEMAQQIGVALAHLHAVPTQQYLPSSFSYGIESFSQIAAENGAFPRWLNDKTQYLIRCIDPELPRGLIHGDLFCDNTVFQGEKLTALLDFEEVCNYFLIFDLGMCAAGCCCPLGKLSVELAAALSRGYQSVRPLSDLEKDLLKLHIEYGAIATAFWRYRQYNVRFPNIGKNHSYEEMSDRADQISALSHEDFMSKVFSH
jgi:homoserine kinase type II